MKTYETQDQLVLKYLHDDNSETAIKAVSSCDTILNPITGKVEHNSVERNKYSVFASVSAGCFMKCEFCYLTLKDMKYQKLSEDTILANLIEALTHQIKVNPALSERYIKLCWMGMGDAIVAPEIVVNVTKRFLSYVFQNKYAKGLDGVDISSVIPNNTNPKWIEAFKYLNLYLKDIPKNPNNEVIVHSEQISSMVTRNKERSPLRLFYSLHSAVQETRDKIIPNSLPLTEAMVQLKFFSDFDRRNLIFHHMFMEGINDSDEEFEALIRFLVDWEIARHHELRILRYNHCDNTPIKESPRFEEFIKELAKVQQRLKVQISTGTEISAACGQFLTNTTGK